MNEAQNAHHGRVFFARVHVRVVLGHRGRDVPRDRADDLARRDLLREVVERQLRRE
ncbi:MAG: hypothetical protein AABZ30_06340 [Myxococcota bacterium]